jgi:hypothetical protein
VPKTSHDKFLKPAKCCGFCLNAEPSSSTLGHVVCPHCASAEARKSHAATLVCVGFSPDEEYEVGNKNA